VELHNNIFCLSANVMMCMYHCVCVPVLFGVHEWYVLSKVVDIQRW